MIQDSTIPLVRVIVFFGPAVLGVRKQCRCCSCSSLCFAAPGLTAIHYPGHVKKLQRVVCPFLFLSFRRQDKGRQKHPCRSMNKECTSPCKTKRQNETVLESRLGYGGPVTLAFFRYFSAMARMNQWCLLFDGVSSSFLSWTRRLSPTQHQHQHQMSVTARPHHERSNISTLNKSFASVGLQTQVQVQRANKKRGSQP